MGIKWQGRALGNITVQSGVKCRTSKHPKSVKLKLCGCVVSHTDITEDGEGKSRSRGREQEARETACSVKSLPRKHESMISNLQCTRRMPVTSGCRRYR